MRLRVETQIGYTACEIPATHVVTGEFIDTGDTGRAWLQASE